MRSSRWQAQGNVYLVAEEPLTAERRPRRGRRRRRHPRGARGRGDDWLEIVIWNPDGSQAEMSGNGTRIAARWLAEQTGAADVTVRVGPREVDRADARRTGSSSRTSARSSSASRRRSTGSASRRSTSATRTRSSRATRPSCRASARRSRRTRASRTARTSRSPAASARATIEARVWERGVGETGSSGTSAVAVAAALGGGAATVRFPGGDLHVQLDGRTGAAHRAGRAHVTRPSLYRRCRASPLAAPRDRSHRTDDGLDGERRPALAHLPDRDRGFLGRAAELLDRRHENRDTGDPQGARQEPLPEGRRRARRAGRGDQARRRRRSSVVAGVHGRRRRPRRCDRARPPRRMRRPGS